MSKCSKCGAPIEDGMKFCQECGEAISVASGVSFGDKNVIAGDVAGRIEQSDNGGAAKLSRGGSDDNHGGIAIGDKNVVAGDVIGHLESYKISGDATIVKNTDETKKMVQCHVCGRNMTIDESFDCPVCHEKTCCDCFSRERGACNACSSQDIKEKEAEYENALKRVYASGRVGLSERRELIALQKRLGIAAARAIELENIVKSRLSSEMSDSLSTFERFSLDKAKMELFENCKPKEAVDLLAPIYKAHALDEDVLTTYLTALAVGDKCAAEAIISSLQIDVLGAYLVEIDMALADRDVSRAEERLLLAESLWPDSNLLKCRRIKFMKLMYDETSDDSFLAEASNALIELGEPRSSLEASWILYVQNLVSMALGDFVPEVSEEYCKKNNLYYGVASGRLYA